MKNSSTSILVFLLGLMVCSCGPISNSPSVSRIIDHTGGDSVLIDISYDIYGRVSSFANAPISYDGDQINVGNIKPILGYGSYFDITFYLNDDRVEKSLARCEEVICGTSTVVEKETTYSYPDNQIVVESKSVDAHTRKLLKVHKEIREMGENGTLRRTTYTDSDRGNGVAAYSYDSNLTCSADINMQAFLYSSNGMDDLLVFLLNLNDMPQTNILPNEVNFTYPHNVTRMHNINSCLEGDRLTKMEVIRNYESLLARVSFEYED